MTPDTIKAVQDSFDDVAPIAPQAAKLFYGRLFEIAPETQGLFRADMDVQGIKLMTTLGAVVNSLNNLEAILPAVKELAIRHVEYGVKPEHYTPVGEALLWTLEQGLGEKFTNEVKAAWTEAYGLLSVTMIDAAYGEKAA